MTAPILRRINPSKPIKTPTLKSRLNQPATLSAINPIKIQIQPETVQTFQAQTSQAIPIRKRGTKVPRLSRTLSRRLRQPKKVRLLNRRRQNRRPAVTRELDAFPRLEVCNR